jgi:hypothetical protein
MAGVRARRGGGDRGRGRRGESDLPVEGEEAVCPVAPSPRRPVSPSPRLPVAPSPRRPVLLLRVSRLSVLLLPAPYLFPVLPL